MRAQAAGIISQALRDMGIPVESGIWRSDIEMPYIVGELSDDGGSSEDGRHGGRYVLNCWDVGGMGRLYRIKDSIEDRFDCEPIVMEDGSVLIVDYAGCTGIQTGEPDLFRLQITLQVTEWRNY